MKRNYHVRSRKNEGISYRVIVSVSEVCSSALEPAWITSRQIEAGRRAMTRNARRGGKIWYVYFLTNLLQ
ncbi:50S ribosomal protein L16 chloroplastic [Bienertia sinuspersici]